MSLRAVLPPAIFVFLWSTGFIVAKLALPYTQSGTFLTLRYWLAAILLGGVAVLGAATWPRRASDVGHCAVAGLLMHFVYIGGVFTAIERGLPAGVSALIVSLQPLLTAVAAGPLLGETVTRWQWLGLVLGLIGTALVVWEKAQVGSATLVTVLLSVVALLGMTAGTLWQKRFMGGIDLRTGTATQYIITAIAFSICTLLFERIEVTWTLDLTIALVWSVLAMSVGAAMLLLWLIRRGAATGVAALFYLVPPCTAVMAWLLFGERLGALALLGMAVTVVGVALATRR
ncbi:DMT family transporter [Reyranella sp. CPCC 100927]|uniref:DMT family transporter n=1 Tax=Reyranella sp. CPCC 100927 TaxID=2599616 RepID=UPI002105125B|nr:DMT family transporter [Reyranella sp. CPCC 100927]